MTQHHSPPWSAAQINSLQQFRVITGGGTRPADFAVTITAPSGRRVKAHVVPTAEGFLVNFTPTELGHYLLSISFGGVPIAPAPYRFLCLSNADPSRVIAYGPGLDQGLVNRPAEFVVDTRGAGHGSLGITIEGPCEAAISCRDNGDGTCDVAYLPTEIGEYLINVAYDRRHIEGSPFMAVVTSDADVWNVRVLGNGIQPRGMHQPWSGFCMGYPLIVASKNGLIINIVSQS